MSDIILKDESFRIQGSVFEVYRELGCGFLEAVYHECLQKEFDLQGIPFKSEPTIELYYKNDLIHHVFRPDFVCFDKIILEIKAVKDLTPEHEAQAINYLKATGLKLALLINFGSHPKATVKRYVR